MRISDWSSDVCSSDLGHRSGGMHAHLGRFVEPGAGAERADHGRRRDTAGLEIGREAEAAVSAVCLRLLAPRREAVDVGGPQCGLEGGRVIAAVVRSEEHTYELPSLMRISYAVFCL